MTRRTQHPSRGQSLLEAVVAIGILATAVSSALTLVQSSIKAGKESETAIVAANLAREGVEVVRAIRDSNWIAGRTWDNGLSSGGFDYTGVPTFNPQSNAWNISFQTDAIEDDGARVFRYTQSSAQGTLGLYRQWPGNATPGGQDAVMTPFRRMLTLNALCDDGLGGWTIATSGSGCGGAAKVGIQVLAHVRWDSSGRTRDQVVEYLLYDWRID